MAGRREDSPTYYEMMPKELVDMCLKCKRENCRGNCKRYADREREINSGGRIDNEGNLLPKGGSAARKYLFRGTYITDKDMADMCDVNISSVRKMRKRGKSMEDIYRFYEQKHKLKGL